MSSNWCVAARTAQRETAAYLTNTHRAEQHCDKQISGGDTNKEPEFDFNPLTQQTIKAVAEPKEIFVFGAKDTTKQPALPAFTQKELFGFGAGSSASQPTPTGSKLGVRRGVYFPTRFPAVLLRTSLMGHRPAGANTRNNKRKRRRHDRKGI